MIMYNKGGDFLKYKFLKQDDKLYIKCEKLVLGYIDFFEKDDVILIDKVIVGESFRGQGIANKLMEQMVDVAEAENKRIKPICSFAVRWFEKNKKFSYIIVKI